MIIFDELPNMLNYKRLVRLSTPPSIAAQGTQNDTPRTNNPAVSPHLTHKIIRQIGDYAENDSIKVPPDLALYEGCKRVPPQFKVSIDPEALQESDTGPPIDSIAQTIVSNTPVDLKALWEDSPFNQDPVFLSSDGVEKFEDKSKRSYNNVKSTAILPEEWIDPICLRTDDTHNYANECLNNLLPLVDLTKL